MQNVAPPSTTDNSLLWQALTQKVSNAATKVLLQQQAFLKSCSETDVVIACSSEAILKLLQTVDRQTHLQNALHAYFGNNQHQVSLIIEKPGQAVASVPDIAGAHKTTKQPTRPVAHPEVTAASMVNPHPTAVMTTPSAYHSDANNSPVAPEANTSASPPLVTAAHTHDLESAKQAAMTLLQAKPLDYT